MNLARTLLIERRSPRAALMSFLQPLELGARHCGLFASLERKLPLMLCFLAPRSPATHSARPLPARPSDGLIDEGSSRMAFGPPQRRPLQARLLVRVEPLVM